MNTVALGFTPCLLRAVTVAWLVGLGVAPAHAAVFLTQIVMGLSRPTYLTHAGDGSGRLFITEQGGVIKVLQPGSSAPTVFLDISARVLSPAGTEQGLQSVAFSPNYASDRAFYVFYTRQTDGALVIAGYQVSLVNPNMADRTETPLVTIPHPMFSNHNGGQLQFGPDGCLYASTGDGGGGGDPFRNAQNPASLLGKLLRLDPVTGGPCTNVTPNPGAGRIWALGLRNPFRFSFDRQTGELYIADVGQDTREEVDVQPAGAAGLNYCWSALEGTLPFNGDQSCTIGIPTAPILEYGHTGGRCAIIGGYAYRGAARTLPPGVYIFGDLCSGEIFLRQGPFTSLLFDTSFTIFSFGEDQAGELYVVAGNGTVWRIDGTGGPELSLGLDTLFPYGTGDTLGVGIGARNPGPAFPADVYVGVLAPGGSTAVFFTGTPLTAVTVPVSADPRAFPRFLTGVSVPAGLSAPMGPLLAHTFAGTETRGKYTLFAALVVPGAFADGRIDPSDVIAVVFQPFDFP